MFILQGLNDPSVFYSGGGPSIFGIVSIGLSAIVVITIMWIVTDFLLSKPGIILGLSLTLIVVVGTGLLMLQVPKEVGYNLEVFQNEISERYAIDLTDEQAEALLETPITDEVPIASNGVLVQISTGDDALGYFYKGETSWRLVLIESIETFSFVEE